ncbi:hypothetical protein Pelo_11770 [Pelomyxa schiedti]|nr:hypothetical protein Pelo_11770 [Pelomyxa schiedti]
MLEDVGILEFTVDVPMMDLLLNWSDQLERGARTVCAATNCPNCAPCPSTHRGIGQLEKVDGGRQMKELFGREEIKRKEQETTEQKEIGEREAEKQGPSKTPQRESVTQETKINNEAEKSQNLNVTATASLVGDKGSHQEGGLKGEQENLFSRKEENIGDIPCNNSSVAPCVSAELSESPRTKDVEQRTSEEKALAASHEVQSPGEGSTSEIRTTVFSRFPDRQRAKLSHLTSSRPSAPKDRKHISDFRSLKVPNPDTITAKTYKVIVVEDDESDRHRPPRGVGVPMGMCMLPVDSKTSLKCIARTSPSADPRKAPSGGDNFASLASVVLKPRPGSQPFLKPDSSSAAPSPEPQTKPVKPTFALPKPKEKGEKPGTPVFQLSKKVLPPPAVVASTPTTALDGTPEPTPATPPSQESTVEPPNKEESPPNATVTESAAAAKTVTSPPLRPTPLTPTRKQISIEKLMQPAQYVPMPPASTVVLKPASSRTPLPKATVVSSPEPPSPSSNNMGPTVTVHHGPQATIGPATEKTLGSGQLDYRSVLRKKQ